MKISRIIALFLALTLTSCGSIFAAEIDAPEDQFRGTVADSASSGIWASTAASLKDSNMEKLNLYLGKLSELD